MSGTQLRITVILGMAVWFLAAQAWSADAAYSWHVPDRAAKVAKLIPGRQIPVSSPDEFLAEWTRGQMKKWEEDHEALEPEAAYEQYSQVAPADEELAALMPDHISPFGRVLEGDPGEQKAKGVMISYCPFCGRMATWALPGVSLDSQNPYHGKLGCCGQDLYEREQDMPADYKLRPNSTAEFLHLDGTVKEVPGYTFTDKDGVKWQIFPGTMVACHRWLGIGSRADAYMSGFQRTGDPLCVHKLAVLLDRVADVYYGLPLCYRNELATGADGKPLTREEWEALPRPARAKEVFAGVGGNKSYWNRRSPLISRGWIFQGNELTWVEPFARVRHHPAFKYYSEKKYGDPEALDRKIMTKLMRELALLFETFPLESDYQDGSYTDLLMLAILLQDEYLYDFAAGHQECVLYNHHYHDGMNGEGAPNYMAMLTRYYDFMQDAKGWLEFAPDFLTEHPFFAVADAEWHKLTTVRGLWLEFADQHIHPFETSFLTNPATVQANEQRPSMNWPGYGIGIVRVGGPGHRQEVSMIYDRVSLHGAADKLGIECWVDGVPVMREGGYAAHWHTAHLDESRPEIKQFLALPYPHEVFEVVPEAGRDFNCWNWAHGPWAHNTVTVNEEKTGPGWSDREGFGELVTFKGGEAPNEPGAHFQVLDSRDLFSFERMGVEVDEFRRSILAVEGPDGRPYAVDIVRVDGGRRHTLFESAWAERVAADLPAVVREEESLATYLDKLRGQPPDTLPYRNEYKQIGPVQVLGETPPTWDVTWRTDCAAYVPFDASGQKPPRPLPEGVGIARLRLLGLRTDERTTLLSGKGPWVAWMNQPLPKGKSVNGNVGFRDAWDYVIESRTLGDGSEAETLTSTYLHIMEGFREGESSVIKQVERLAPVESSGPAEEVVALKLEMAGGHTDTVIFQPGPGEVRLPGDLRTDARYALVRRNADGELLEANMVRGTMLECGEFLVKTSGDFAGTIVDLIGDLTGTRKETALIVRPEGKWPLGLALAGKPISIDVVSGHKEAYDIAKVTEFGEGLLRVDLARHAPLTMGWYQVASLDEEKTNRLRSNRQLWAGINSPWWSGAYAWFPEKNKRYTIEKTHSDRKMMDVVGEVNFEADGIEPGDWFTIYAIEPGQTVTVAGDLALWREGDSGGAAGGGRWTLPMRYCMRATGAASITIPAKRGEIWCRCGDGDWQKLEGVFDSKRRVATLTVPANETAEQTVWLLTDKPDWLALQDSGPPQIAKVLLDDKPLEVQAEMALGRIPPPEKLVIEARDEHNPIDERSIRVSLDGKRIGGNLVSIKMTPKEPKRVMIEVALGRALAEEPKDQPGYHGVTVTLDDMAVDQRSTSLALSYRKLIPVAENAVYLSDLREVRSFIHGALRKDTNYYGKLLKMNGEVYDKGLHTHPEPGVDGPDAAYAEVIYDLAEVPGRKMLRAVIGIDDTAGANGSCVFKVQVGTDGKWKTLYTSPLLRGSDIPVEIAVDISGAKLLRLYCTGGGDGIGHDHAAWANVRLE